MANHLWQSTFFALAAGLLTLAMRRNRAAVRYGIWFAASLKFLLPFSLLVLAGGWLPSPAARPITPSAAPMAVVEEMVQPFAASASLPEASERANWRPMALWAVWACGFLAVVGLRRRDWRSIRAAVRASRHVEVRGTVEIRTTPGMIEPGVVGWRRPVLLLPEGIEGRLTAAQLEAVVAHELCHVRRQDNLLSAIHMVVEALFWFHPLVWWIGARMIAERERACDEAVVGAGSRPNEYAEAILQICKLYAELPLQCVAGVTGADIRKRIEAIMANRAVRRLNAVNQAALASAAAILVALPLAVGMMHARPQAPQGPVPRFEVASVKLCKPDDASGGRGASVRGGVSPDRLELACQPLASLIEQAYSTSEGGLSLPITGQPGWMESERYRVDAKAEAPERWQTMAGPMLRALLEERFHLKLHRESKEVPVYFLMPEKGGPKLTAFTEGSCESAAEMKTLQRRDRPKPCGIFFEKTSTPGLFTLNTRGMTMAALCDNLSHLMDHPVTDKTGISGRFDLRVEFSSDETTPALRPGGGMARFGEVPEGTVPDPGASLPIAIQQLGLKLEPGKGPRDSLVIDHVERPTEN